MNAIESEFIVLQQEMCLKYSAEFVTCPFHHMIGVALDSFRTFAMPVNGLRHPPESTTGTNWFLWCGEYSEADDFFQAIHVRHLLDVCPKALRYLGLGPGWRFLFDNVYEDVWFDEKLLDLS
jgi:hypothetical protein